jgi:hypothetical protein
LQLTEKRYGINIVGKPFSEELVIKVAFAIEEITRCRERARHHILPSVDLIDIVKVRETQ